MSQMTQFHPCQYYFHGDTFEADLHVKIVEYLQLGGYDVDPGRKLSIIAMKGHPFTRKTEFANIIATSLKCPIFSLELLLRDLKSPSSPKQEEEKAFLVICRMAVHNLFKGTCRNAVIDSPLSSKWHLEQLTKAASSLKPMAARVVVIECKPINAYLWQMDLERHMRNYEPLPWEWYKVKKWEDVEKAIQVNGDYDERSVERGDLVSKLVVNPPVDYPVDFLEHGSDSFGFSLKPRTTSDLLEAVKYMMTRDQEDGQNVVHLHQWRSQIQQVESYCTTVGHSIIASKLQHEPAAVCRACENPINDLNQKKKKKSDYSAHYSCKHCSLALHKECAESFDETNNWGDHWDETNVAIHHSPLYRFPHEFACNPCRESGKGFSTECCSCLFETHLKCRLKPTVIRHFDTEEHILTIALLPHTTEVNREIFRCSACGIADRFGMYRCQICGVAFHFKCVNLPRQVEHVHGLHHHRLSLEFISEKAEDYLCHECQYFRDPDLWFYSCQACPYELHPNCVDTLSR